MSSPAAPTPDALSNRSVNYFEDNLRRGVLIVISVTYGVLGICSAVAFAFLDGGAISTIVLGLGGVLSFLVTYLARRVKVTAAAILLTSLFWVALMIEPVATGNLSTNGLFMGLLAALMAVSFRQKWLWLSAVVSVGCVGLLALVTDASSTPPIGWLSSMVNGTLLVVATAAAVGIVLWQSGRQLLAEALADRAVKANIEDLRTYNTDLERQISERTAHLRTALAERQRAAEALREWSATDTLTGLRNRGALDEEVRRRSSANTAQPTAVLVIDMDDFKAINDTHSHLVGDQVLQRVAQILRQGAPSSATIARFGGEEFVILAPATIPAEVVEMAQALVTQIAAEDWQWLADDLGTKASAGLCFAADRSDPNSPPVADAILRAFQAMGTAKARGGNRVEIR